ASSAARPRSGGVKQTYRWFGGHRHARSRPPLVTTGGVVSRTDMDTEQLAFAAPSLTVTVAEHVSEHDFASRHSSGSTRAGSSSVPAGQSVVHAYESGAPARLAEADASRCTHCLPPLHSTVCGQPARHATPLPHCGVQRLRQTATPPT